jgi:hypothetical protein
VVAIYVRYRDSENRTKHPRDRVQNGRLETGTCAESNGERLVVVDKGRADHVRDAVSV